MTTSEESPRTELHDVARRLYGLPPEEFTAARTTAVAEIRGRDRELAAAVKALRRPAVAAWAVNLLVRERAELVAQVQQVGESLREASAQLAGDALRDLTRQRRQVVAAVAREVEELARQHGQRLTPAVVRQVEETLNAAITDRRAAQALASGVLAQPLGTTGLESLAEALGVPGLTGPGVPPSGDQAAPETKPTLSLVPEDSEARRADAEAAAARRAEKAQKALRKASKSHDKAVRTHAKAQARLLQLEVGLEELRRQVAAAEAEAEAAAAVVAEREAAVEATQAALADATQAAEQAAEQAARHNAPSD